MDETKEKLERDKDGEGETEEGKKRGRGRPRKDEKLQGTASKQMKNFLEKGNCGFTVNLGGRGRLQHSPIRREREEEKGKRKDESEEEDPGEDVESTAGIRKEGETERKEEEAGKSSQRDGTMEKSTLPTGTEVDGSGEAARKDGGETTDGSTGPAGDGTTVNGGENEENARLVKLVRELEARLDRSMAENERNANELRLVRELESDRLERLDRERELQEVKKIGDENRIRIEMLEKELRDALG